MSEQPPVQAPQPPPSPWSIFRTRLREQPVFCGVLLLIAVGSPWGYAWLQGRQQHTHQAHALGLWHHTLEGAGLPAPFVVPEDVRPPAGLRALPPGAPEELHELRALLDCWRALRNGEQAPVPSVTSQAARPLRAALAACASLRAAAAGDGAALTQARDASGGAVEAWRPTLDLVADLIAGQSASVLTRARGMLSGKVPRACQTVLQVLVREAAARRAAELLEHRPASTATLDELAALVKGHPEAVAAVAAAGPRIAELAAPGAGDVARCQRLLEVLGAAQPGGAATHPGWSAVLSALDAVVGRHLGGDDSDPGPALALVGVVARIDPQADLPAPRAYAGWRAGLEVALDRPERLVEYAVRLLESGRLPVGVEEVLASHAQGAAVPAALRTAGAELARLLLLSLAHPVEAEAIAAQAAEVERALGERVDPGATRIRAWAAFVAGRVGGDPVGAAALLARAEAHGFEPRPALLAAQAKWLPADQATKRLRDRARLIDERAAKARALGPEEALEWELAGYPTAHRVIDRWRASARVDLAAHLVEHGQADEALEEARRALALAPQAARSHLVVALAHRAAGRPSSARSAVERGLRAVGADEPEIADRLRRLASELADQ